jgi:pyruvate dehydrogenase E1 component alpha subunit
VEEFHAGNIPGVVHAYIGQEAIATGVCTALRRDDKIVSTHRGHTIQ